VFDWFDGLADLDARRIRFIGDPLTRIAEDHLRILRFFRFHARFGRGEPDAAGLEACAARANDLMALSRERIAGELVKLLEADDPAPAVATMIAYGIFAPVVPEFVDAAPLARCVEREAELGVTPDPVRRLAAMIGSKPELATSLAGRLKLSKAVAKRLAAAAAPLPGTAEAVAYHRGAETAIDQLILGNGTRAEATQIAAWQVPKLPISGGALIARGLAAGPDVARTLGRIESQWVEAGFPTGAAFDAIVDEEVRHVR
jgi:poly(A) polymerase